MTGEQFHVGQQVWFVPNEKYHGEPRYLTVTKLGRRWIVTNQRGKRFDRETLVIDGGGYNSPGRVWLDKEEWEAESAKSKAWEEMHGVMRGLWKAPAHLTTEQIKAMTETVKGPVPHAH